MAVHERGINMMGKPVYLLLNGNNYNRKRFVVNQREMPEFECLLQAAAASFRTPAREIRTPGGRHRIRKLDDLQRDCNYVVVGREPFKKVGYEVKELKPTRLPPIKGPEVNFVELNHRKFRNIPGKARIIGRRKKEEIKTIIVFCNGIVAKPRRVQLRTDYKMFQVLESVNDKVSSVSKNGAVYDLFTLDGHKISEPSQLDDNGQYVAVGRERYFDRSVPYNDQGVAAQLTPRRASTKPKVTERKPPSKHLRFTFLALMVALHERCSKKNVKKKPLVVDNDEPINNLAADIASRDLNGINSSPESAKEAEPLSLFESFKDTVTESLRDDEPQRDHTAERTDSPHESEIEDIPIEETIHSKVADFLGDNGVPLEDLVDDKQDNSDDGKPSVYKASGDDKEDAREIQDDKETIEDKPIDQMPAEEVADEEIEAGNNENNEAAGEEINNDNEEEVHEEELEENREAKEKDNEQDNEQDHPEANEPQESVQESPVQ
ncbi:hypothetical protein OS493_036898 [Desmophyllum pertusum]|uniref:Doublecortin domain-containing protein n=1 Tax=Desmophyllum pertusum TaxID=174260 RepID=A0A9W9YJH4_9CNID|nr:hypothetical protein OS493_036898 [Desmophyllum pertusum]